MQNNELIPSFTDTPMVASITDKSCTDPVEFSKHSMAFILNNPKVEKASTTDKSCTNPVEISKCNDASNPTNCEAENTNKTDDPCTDPVQTSEIETVDESLLETLKEEESPNIEQDKEKIITQFHHEDDIVDLEINEWLTVDSWGNTPATQDMIPVDFEDL